MAPESPRPEAPPHDLAGLGKTQPTAAPLRLISEVTDRLVQTLDFDEALDVLIDGATELLGVARASVMIIDADRQELAIKVGRGLSPEIIERTRIPLGQGIAGTVAATGQPLVVQDVRELDQWQSTSKVQATEYQDSSALSVPLVIHGEVQGVMNFNHKLDGTPLDDGDLDLALVVANQATVALYLAMLHRQYLKKQALEYELGVARSIQQRLHPSQLPECKGLQFAAHSLMCHQVGGDYYDFVNLPEGCLGVAIGDVAGHGLGPALLVADARASIRSGFHRGNSLERCLADLNELLQLETSQEIYMTMLLGVLDPATKTLELATAGHHLPVILRQGSPVVLPKAGANIPLGIRDSHDFEREQPIQLRSGDLILLFTDGIWEAESPQGTRFGNEGIVEVLQRQSDRSGGEIIKELLDCVHAHCAENELVDDCTLVTIQVT